MSKIVKAMHLLARRAYWKGIPVGVAAAIEHRHFLQIHRFATVLDAGANTGQFALAVRASDPAAKIISFEPLPGPARRYERVFAADHNTRLVRCALGSADGESTIHISHRDDSSSLLAIGAVQTTTFPGTEERGQLTVPVKRLDAVVAAADLAGPVLLKMDVQGYELEVLKGAEKLLPAIDSIYSELSFLQLYEGQPLAHEVIDWLARHGFALAGVYHIAYRSDGMAVQADFHFSRA